MFLDYIPQRDAALTCFPFIIWQTRLPIAEPSQEAGGLPTMGRTLPLIMGVFLISAMDGSPVCFCFGKSGQAVKPTFPDDDSDISGAGEHAQPNGITSNQTDSAHLLVRSLIGVAMQPS